MSYHYPDFDEPRPWRSFLVGLALGLVLLGATWAATAVLSEDDEPASTGDRSATFQMQRGSAVSQDEQDTAEDACREVRSGQTEVVRFGQPALDEWRVHIGAMNKLVTGTITLRQANDFWDETRIGARRHLDRYHQARREYGARTVRCPGHDAAMAGTVTPCAVEARAGHREVRLLRRALATWQRHVRHMEMLRHGHMSATRATQLWLSSWREGLTEVRAYQQAASHTHPGRCPG